MNSRNAITPSTNLYLLKLPLELSDRNQLTWSNKEEQYNYFSNLEKLEVNNFTYQRKDSIIRYSANVDSILNYNYVMYQNENYSDKWFYAYIEEMRYINDSMTEIIIKTDVFQTWLFDMEFKDSFVEREHVSDDTIGFHTIPEGLELGEYTTIFHEIEPWNNDTTNILASTTDPDSLSGITGGIFGGIPSGLRYYRYDTIGLASDTTATTLLGAINRLNNDGKQDAITGLFLAPKWLSGEDSKNIPIANSDTPQTKTIEISKINSLNGYAPKNNKLFTYPYCLLEVSNNSGQATVYYPERWNTNTNNKYEMIMRGTLTPGCSIRIYPKNYNGDFNPYDEGITLGKFPQLNWITDQYTNWLTQNGVGIGVLKIPANLVNLGEPIVDLATSKTPFQQGMALSSVYNAIRTNYQHSILPNTAEGNLNSGDVTAGMKENRFHFYGRTIKSEYAKVIDKYFSMFGYKINEVKVPELNTRKYWNYIKCVGANIHGYFNQSDLNELSNMFNNGVTLWHSPNNFLNYSLDNTIVRS